MAINPNTVTPVVIRNALDTVDPVVQPVDNTGGAQQQFKDESDINTIVNKYMDTGILGNPNASRRPLFGDFSSVDFLAMNNAIADIEQKFMSLPARVRARFENDPYQVVRFVEDPNNAKEAIKLGLMPDPNPPPPPVPVGTPVASAPVQQDFVSQAALATAKTAPAPSIT